MCTAGVIYTEDNKLLAFKNCDINFKMELAEKPVIMNGKGMKYVKFGGKKNPRKTGYWTAANTKGVCCLGLDGNGLVNYRDKKFGNISHIMKAYEAGIKNGRTAKEAAWIIINKFQEYKQGISDIIILADRKEAIMVDYSFNEWGLKFLPKPGYVVRTNFFRVLRHLRPAPEENSIHMSSAKRYERALELLSITTNKTTVDDLKKLCSDHDNGPSAISICRHGGQKEYNTVGTAIFEIKGNSRKVHYVCNGYPCEKEFKTFKF